MGRAVLLFVAVGAAVRCDALAARARHPSPALDALEACVDAALAPGRPIESLEAGERESVAVARRLRQRMDNFARNDDCRRCWLQRAHCVCDSTPALDARPSPPLSGFGRLFVVMHHKEVLLAVDTAKLLLAAYPDRTHLIVGGLGGQPAEAAMRASLERGTAAVLFPSEDAVPAADVAAAGGAPLDVVVLDGTWSQARKLYHRLPAAGPRVKLDDETVGVLATGQGRQLRTHPTKWREVSTLSAVRHLLGALGVETVASLRDYQAVADAAARRQLGPPRLRPGPPPGAPA